MKPTTSLFLIILLLPISAAMSAATNISTNQPTGNNILNSLPPYSTLYDPNRDAFKDGAAAVELATRTNRRILVELGGDWCKWCHVLDDFLDNNADIKQQLHETFVILKINVSDANNNADFLKAFPRPLGYPHMYVSEHNGSILWSKDTAELVQNGQYSRDRFLAFFQRWHINNKNEKHNEK